MTNSYSALCAELAEEVEHLWSIVRDDNNEPHPLVNRARALLAQPEQFIQMDPGRIQRGNGIGGPTTPKPAIIPNGQRHYAALAQPVAGGPTDEELTLTYAYAVAAAVGNKRGQFTTEDIEAAQLAGLRAVLAKWGHQ